jgi:hypothetical protein
MYKKEKIMQFHADLMHRGLALLNFEIDRLDSKAKDQTRCDLIDSSWCTCFHRPIFPESGEARSKGSDIKSAIIYERSEFMSINRPKSDSPRSDRQQSECLLPSTKTVEYAGKRRSTLERM